MTKRIHLTLALFVLISLALQSCGAAPASSTQDIISLTEAPSPTFTPTTEVVSSPTDIPQPTQIQHLVQPDNPVYITEQQIRDCVMDASYVPGQLMYVPKSCDLWDIDFVERPISSDLASYYPYLDILYSQFGANKDWIFARIDLIDTAIPAEHDNIYYMLEFDLDLDNISDVLIAVENLRPTDVLWTVNNVRAWRFENGNVVQIFDQGVGDDPDAIWVRRSSMELSTTIEFALKPSVLNGDNTFAWWAWTYEGELDPALFVPLDLMPDTYKIDNTCAVGFNVDAINLHNNCRK